MGSLGEELHDASATGDIWKDNWWHKSVWRDELGLSLSEIDTRICVLRENFTPQWVKSLGDSLPYHPVIQNVYFGEGRSNLAYLLQLSEQISGLRKIPGFGRVLSAYKEVGTAKSAELEMFMAHVVKQAGCAVEFIAPKPKKGKTPDILVRSGSREFVVECKFLQDTAEQWMREYQMHFGSLVIDCIPKGVACIYMAEEPKLDVRRYGYPRKLTPPYIAASVDVRALREAIKCLGTGAPAWMTISGKGTLGVLHESETCRSSIQIPDLDTRFLLKRLLNNGVKKASTQINAYGLPGIIAVFHSTPADYTFLKLAFLALVREAPEEVRDIVGLLVFPMQNILQYVRPMWIANPVNSLSLKELGLNEPFTTSLCPIGL